jgi:hypothetical protein
MDRISIPGRNRLLSSLQCPDRLWDPRSLLFPRLRGPAPGRKGPVVTLIAHLDLVPTLIFHKAVIPPHSFLHGVHKDSLYVTFAESQASHAVSGPLRPEVSPAVSKKLVSVACHKPFQSRPCPHIITLRYLFLNIIFNIKMDLKNEEWKCGRRLI